MILISSGLVPKNINISNDKKAETKKYTYNTSISTETLTKYIDSYKMIYDNISFLITTDIDKSNINGSNEISENIQKNITTYLKTEITSLLTSKKYSVVVPSNETNKNSFINSTPEQQKALNAKADYILLIQLNSIDIEKKASNYVLKNAMFTYKIKSSINGNIIASVNINKLDAYTTVGSNSAKAVMELSKLQMSELSLNSLQLGNSNEHSIFSQFNKKLSKDGYFFTIFVQQPSGIESQFNNSLKLSKDNYSFDIENSEINSVNTLQIDLKNCKFDKAKFVDDLIANINKKYSIVLKKQKVENNYCILNNSIHTTINTNYTNKSVDNSENIEFKSNSVVILDPVSEFKDFELDTDIKTLKIRIEDNFGVEFLYFTKKKYNKKIKITLLQDFLFINGRTYSFEINDGEQVMDKEYK